MPDTLLEAMMWRWNGQRSQQLAAREEASAFPGGGLARRELAGCGLVGRGLGPTAAASSVAGRRTRLRRLLVAMGTCVALWSVALTIGCEEGADGEGASSNPAPAATETAPSESGPSGGAIDDAAIVQQCADAVTAMRDRDIPTLAELTHRTVRLGLASVEEGTQPWFDLIHSPAMEAATRWDGRLRDVRRNRDPQDSGREIVTCWFGYTADGDAAQLLMRPDGDAWWAAEPQTELLEDVELETGGPLPIPDALQAASIEPPVADDPSAEAAKERCVEVLDLLGAAEPGPVIAETRASNRAAIASFDEQAPAWERLSRQLEFVDLYWGGELRGMRVGEGFRSRREAQCWFATGGGGTLGVLVLVPELGRWVMDDLRFVDTATWREFGEATWSPEPADEEAVKALDEELKRLTKLEGEDAEPAARIEVLKQIYATRTKRSQRQRHAVAIALSHRDLGELDAARDWLNTALDIDVDSGLARDAWGLVGELHGETGDSDAHLEDTLHHQRRLEFALGVDATDRRKNRLASVLMTRLALEAPEPDAKRALIERTLELDPQNARALELVEELRAAAAEDDAASAEPSGEPSDGP